MSQQKTAVILAGGKSSRMNRKNKALMPFNNKTIIEKVIETVSMFDEIIIVANEPELYEKFGYKVISDIYKDKGPLGGIHAGLIHASHDKVLIVACDMPNISIEITQKMYNYKGEYDALLSFDGDELHPLFSIYDKTCLSEIESHIKTDKLKLKLFLKEVNTVVMDWRNQLGEDQPTRFFKNINTPTDYKLLLKSIRNKPMITCIVGASNSGKTTLIQKLISELNERGYRVGTIKQSHHTDLLDTQKDDMKHYQAGANKTILVGQNTITTIQRISEEVVLEEMVEQFDNVDIILVEGYKTSKYTKLEIVRSEISEESMCDSKDLKAIISDITNEKWNCPVIGLEDINAVIECVLDREVRHK